MAVSSENFKTIFNCDGSTVDFDFDFKVFDEADLEVIHVSATGVETTLTLTTNYTVSGLTETGGRVTTVATYASGVTLVVRRSQEKIQELDYQQNDIMSTAVLEDQLDKIVMMIQEQEERINRSILAASTQTEAFVLPEGESDKLIGWDTAGTALENKTALDADVQAACEAAQTAAETAETNAETAETAAEAAQTAAEAAASSIPEVDTDGTLAANSDSKIATQKATKTYADTKLSLNIDEEIEGLDEKSSPDGTDLVIIEDSDDDYSKKKVQVSKLYGIPAASIYDSGWFGASVATAYTKSHNLGTTMVMVNVWCADDADGTNKFIVGYADVRQDAGAAMQTSVVKNLGNTGYTLQTGATGIATNLDTDGNQTGKATGWLRVLMLALGEDSLPI